MGRTKKPTRAILEAQEEAEARAVAHEARTKPKRKPKEPAPEPPRPVKLKIKPPRRDFSGDDVPRAAADAFADEDARIEAAHISEDDTNEEEEDSEEDEATRQERIALETALASLKANKKSKQSKKKVTAALDDEFATPQPTARPSTQPKRRRTKEPVTVLDSDEELQQAQEAQILMEKKLCAIEYKINWRVFFENKAIGEHTDVKTVMGAGRFSYLTVVNAAKKLALQHAAKESLTWAHLNDVATLTWSGIKNTDKTVTNLSDWQAYDTAMIPQLRIALTQKPVRNQPVVYITLHYHRNAEGVIPESQRPPPPPAALPTMASIKVQQALDKQKKEKAEEGKREANKEDTLLQLIAHLKCMEPRCSNHEGGQCYVVTPRHYEVGPRHLKMWHELLITGRHSINVCPVNIKRELPATTFRGKKPFGGAAAETAESSTPSTATDKSGIDQVVKVMSMQMLKDLKEDMKKPSPRSRSPSPRKRYHRSSGSRRHKRRRHRESSSSSSGYSDGTPKPPRRRSRTSRRSVPSRRAYTPSPDLPMSNTRSRALSTIPDASAPRSSPVKPTGGANEQVDSYIRWQTRTHRTLPRGEAEYRAFMAAGVILKDNFYDLRMIQAKKHDSTADAWWSALGIRPGVGAMLAADVKEYHEWSMMQDHMRSDRNLDVGLRSKSYFLSPAPI